MSRSSRWRGEGAYAAVYGGLYTSLAAQLAFLTLWLQQWGLEAAEIGWVNAVVVAVRIFAGFAAPALADRLGRPRAVMVTAGLAGAAAVGMLSMAGTRTEIYLFVALLSICCAALIPMSEAHGYAGAQRVGFSYQRARSAGSVAFMATTFLCGVTVQAYGLDVTMIWLAAPLLIVAAGAMLAPMQHGAAARPAARSAANSTEQQTAPEPSDQTRGWMTSSVFLLFVLSVASIQSAHGVYYVYGSLHWRSLGLSESLIGALWSWGVIAEIGVFMIGAQVIARLGAVRALAIAGGAAILRWSIMSLDPPLAALIALQALHGVTFGVTHLATMALIQNIAPPNRIATAQGLLAAGAGGVGMLIATLAAAQAYPLIQGGAYLIGALLGASGLVAALLLARLGAPGLERRGDEPQPQSAGSGANMVEPL